MERSEFRAPLIERELGEHHVLVDGLRLHYLDSGGRSRPPLLFLPGGCLTAHTWDLVCLALRREFHGVARDHEPRCAWPGACVGDWPAAAGAGSE